MSAVVACSNGVNIECACLEVLFLSLCLPSFFLFLSADQCVSLRFSNTAGQQIIETNGREVQGENQTNENPTPKQLPPFPRSKWLNQDLFGKDENAECGLHS